MICDLVDQFGEPWVGCPRGALKRMLHNVETLFDGMMYMAFEQESYLLKEVDGKLVPADQTLCLSIEGMDFHLRHFSYKY